MYSSIDKTPNMASQRSTVRFREWGGLGPYRFLLCSKQDYIAAKERLCVLAEGEEGQIWYDEGKDSMGFRGQSLEHLSLLADKCTIVLQSERRSRGELSRQLAKCETWHFLGGMNEMKKKKKRENIIVVNIDLSRAHWKRQDFWNEVERTKCEYNMIHERISHTRRKWMVRGLEQYANAYAKHIYSLCELKKPSTTCRRKLFG